MKKTLTVIALVALGASMIAAVDKVRLQGGPTEYVATGDGSFRYQDPEHGDGVGVLSFTLTQSESTSGRFVFAAEHAHDYPDIVIRLWEIELAQFSANTVVFAGMGSLHEQPVFISGRAFDGDGTEYPDSFRVRAIDINGEHVFEAEGELTNGNIRVNPQ